MQRFTTALTLILTLLCAACGENVTDPITILPCPAGQQIVGDVCETIPLPETELVVHAVAGIDSDALESSLSGAIGDMNFSISDDPHDTTSSVSMQYIEHCADNLPDAVDASCLRIDVRIKGTMDDASAFVHWSTYTPLDNLSELSTADLAQTVELRQGNSSDMVISRSTEVSVEGDAAILALALEVVTAEKDSCIEYIYAGDASFAFAIAGTALLEDHNGNTLSLPYNIEGTWSDAVYQGNCIVD